MIQDSYALCRVFRKTIQIPKIHKEKVEKPNGNSTSSDAENIEEAAGNWAVSKEQQVLGDDGSGIEISRGAIEKELDDENHEYPKFVPDTSSSDLTQGTPTETAMVDDVQPPSDEANSTASNLYSLAFDCSPYLLQVLYISSFISHACTSQANIGKQTLSF